MDALVLAASRMPGGGVGPAKLTAHRQGREMSCLHDWRRRQASAAALANRLRVTQSSVVTLREMVPESPRRPRDCTAILPDRTARAADDLDRAVRLYAAGASKAARAEAERAAEEEVARVESEKATRETAASSAAGVVAAQRASYMSEAAAIAAQQRRSDIFGLQRDGEERAAELWPHGCDERGERDPAGRAVTWIME